MENQTLELQPTTRDGPLLRALPGIISALAILGGISLRWIGLSEKSLWFDEGYTAWVVSLPMREIMRVIKVDTAPPLYYLLLHGWAGVFGHGEAGLRSMSALVASVAVLVFALIARRIFRNPWARAVAITLFSFSFMQIAYAHEARFYAMMTMLGAIDFYLVLLICDRSSAPRLVALIFAWTISLYTNNMLAIYVACLGGGWLILPGEGRFKDRLRELLIVGICVAVLFSPWVPVMLAQTRRLRAGFWPARPDGWMLLRTIGVMTGAHEQALPRGDGHWFSQVTLLLVTFAALGLQSRKHWRLTAVTAVFGFVPILFIFFYSRSGTSIFVERAFLASGIAMPLLLALALEAARSLPARVVVVGGLAWVFYLHAFSLAGRFTGEQNESWREASDYALRLSSAHEHTLTVFCSNECEVMYDFYARHGDYSPRADLVGTPQGFFELDPPRTLQRVLRDQDVDKLRAALDARPVDSVVLIYSHSWWGDGQGRTLALISSRFKLANAQQFKQIRVYWFSGRR